MSKIVSFRCDDKFYGKLVELSKTLDHKSIRETIRTALNMTYDSMLKEKSAQDKETKADIVNRIATELEKLLKM